MHLLNVEAHDLLINGSQRKIIRGKRVLRLGGYNHTEVQLERRNVPYLEGVPLEFAIPGM